MYVLIRYGDGYVMIGFSNGFLVVVSTEKKEIGQVHVNASCRHYILGGCTYAIFIYIHWLQEHMSRRRR